MYEYVLEEMRKKGYDMRIVSIDHLEELKAEIETLYAGGSLDKEISDFLKGFYDFKEPEPTHKITSILVIAAPSPIVKIHFHHNGKKIPVLMPPTYKEFLNAPDEIEQLLNDLLSKNNYHVERAPGLPEKLLAVHSGLCQYGRNNISYVPDMGSFLFLTAYYSDLPCKDSDWGEVQRMKTCEDCTRCIDACPTGAIKAERSLIYAERCVTYQNEIKSDEDFPDWLDTEAHNCIIGCLHCQMKCPKNKRNLDHCIEGEEFEEEETKYILENMALESLPAALVSKLEHANLKIYYHVLARNLKVLLEQEK